MFTLGAPKLNLQKKYLINLNNIMFKKQVLDQALNKMELKYQSNFSEKCFDTSFPRPGIDLFRYRCLWVKNIEFNST
jgi:hypothetical protein